MKKRKILPFFILFLLLPSLVSAQELSNRWVYITPDVCESILACNKLFPDHTWSNTFILLSTDILNQGNIAGCEQVLAVVNECLALMPADTRLICYKNSLEAGGESISDIEDNSAASITRNCKIFCKLCVRSLTAAELLVTGNTTINGSLIINGTVTGSSSLFASLGTTGSTGATGSIGTMGATGATGAAGAGGILAYGYVFNTSALLNIGSGSAVTFDSDGPLLDVTHTAGSTDIVVTNAGVYSIIFSTTGSALNQFELFVNDVAIPSTLYGTGSASQNTGLAILSLSDGDIITLRNVSILAVSLPTTTGGLGANVNASVHIMRVA